MPEREGRAAQEPDDLFDAAYDGGDAIGDVRPRRAQQPSGEYAHGERPDEFAQDREDGRPGEFARERGNGRPDEWTRERGGADVDGAGRERFAQSGRLAGEGSMREFGRPAGEGSMRESGRPAGRVPAGVARRAMLPRAAPRQTGRRFRTGAGAIAPRQPTIIQTRASPVRRRECRRRLAAAGIRRAGAAPAVRDDSIPGTSATPKPGTEGQRGTISTWTRCCTAESQCPPARDDFDVDETLYGGKAAPARARDDFDVDETLYGGKATSARARDDFDIDEALYGDPRGNARGTGGGSEADEALYGAPRRKKHRRR